MDVLQRAIRARTSVTGMATGTRAGLLDDREPLQSFMKHRVLSTYGMVFTQKLSQGTDLPVVLVDGYAGRGRYGDGTPASAELLLKAAIADKLRKTTVELVEKNVEFCAELRRIGAEYRCHGRGVAHISEGGVEDHLDSILQRAVNSHLFLFLDPCGAGLSFEQLVGLHRRHPQDWPRTEVLLNFNGDLGRRVAAAALGSERDSVLDAVCGGGWWRQSVQKGRTRSPDDWEGALSQLVADYVAHLEQAMPGRMITAVPVKRKYTNQPVFYLVHTTTSGHGLWEISNSIARATRAWRDENELREMGPQGSLFDPPDVVSSMADAKSRVSENLVALSKSTGGYRIVDKARPVLDGALGVLTDAEVGRVARDLAAAQPPRIGLEKASRPAHYVVQPV